MKSRLLGQAIQTTFRNLIRHPKWRWWVVLGSLLYLVSPLDISPDVFPVVGWIDDSLLATIAVTEISQLLLETRRNKGQKLDTQEFTTPQEAVIDVPSIPLN